MSQLGIWEYLFELRQKRVYKPKQRRVLTQIAIYTNELKVYKVAVFADERKKNKWNKYGVNELCKTYTPDIMDGGGIRFPLLKNELKGSEIGYKMFIYNFDKDEIKCFEGEELNRVSF
jgi:hypothetical protein